MHQRTRPIGFTHTQQGYVLRIQVIADQKCLHLIDALGAAQGFGIRGISKRKNMIGDALAGSEFDATGVKRHTLERGGL
jgi:hypothetical protein